MNSNEEGTFIPFSVYTQITNLMPLASVEAVMDIENALLFLSWKNPPAFGEVNLFLPIL
jgi:hypothetical protein